MCCRSGEGLEAEISLETIAVTLVWEDGGSFTQEAVKEDVKETVSFSASWFRYLFKKESHS